MLYKKRIIQDPLPSPLGAQGRRRYFGGGLFG